MTMPLTATAGRLTTTATESWQSWQQAASSARRAARRLLTEPILVTVSLPQSVAVAEVSQPEPPWLYPTLDRLQHLSKLGSNWDSYGGRPPTDEAVFNALLVVSRILSDRSAPPYIVPTSEGGVQLEWHHEGKELEIRVRPNGDVSAFRFDEEAGQGETLERVSVSDLRQLLALTGNL